MEKVGLTLNFIGAFLLVIGSSLQSGVITQIIDTVADAFGTFSMDKGKKLVKRFDLGMPDELPYKLENNVLFFSLYRQLRKGPDLCRYRWNGASENNLRGT